MLQFLQYLQDRGAPRRLRNPSAWLMKQLQIWPEERREGGGALSPLGQLPPSVQRAIGELEERLGGELRAADFDRGVVQVMQVRLQAAGACLAAEACALS